MKVKLFTGMTEGGLENKANRFLENTEIDVKEIQYASTIFSYSVLITYELKTL